MGTVITVNIFIRVLDIHEYYLRGLLVGFLNALPAIKLHRSKDGTHTLFRVLRGLGSPPT